MMSKEWKNHYLLICTIIIVAISSIGSFAFVRTNIFQAQEKYEFESIYVNTAIDFIIPSPSYTQVAEIQDEANGIEVVKPYYETSTPVMINGQTCKGTTLIFPNTENLDVTPYGNDRIIHASSDVQPGTAIVDKLFADMNNCSLGATLSIQIDGKNYEFPVAGISENNTYYSEGSVALFLTETDANTFEVNGIKYSAAYIKASDFSKCKTYLTSEYKPLGRLKGKEDFSSEDTYNEHLQNFTEADWSKEITNCVENYTTLSVKYQNVDSTIIGNSIIYAVVTLLAFTIINIAMLKNDGLKGYFRVYIIKGNGKKEQIIKFYKNGIWWNLSAFIVTNIVFYIYWVKDAVLSNTTYGLYSIVIPLIVAVLVSLVMIHVSVKYVHKHYTINKQKGKDSAQNDDTAS